MNSEQIKHMVNRFLNWKLPENFNPDGGISFKREFNEHTAHPMKHEPSGTNLLDATQADAMVRHMIEGIQDVSDDLIAAAPDLLHFAEKVRDYARETDDESLYAEADDLISKATA